MKSKSRIETVKFHFLYFLFETLKQPGPPEFDIHVTTFSTGVKLVAQFLAEI